MTNSAPKDSIGLALGGGGVKGLAHIPLLKVVDEFELKPARIVGTSMGAIIGALYATGLSGERIEERVRQCVIDSKMAIKELFQRRKQLIKWTKMFGFSRNKGGLVAADGLFEHLFSELQDIHFADLQLPFVAVATNFYSGKDVELSQGELLSAVQASMAIPGVFSPVKRDGMLLVDGGIVNNLPCDKLHGMDCRIASNVLSLSSPSEPKAAQIVNGAIDIALNYNSQQRMHNLEPHLVFKPDTAGIEVFDFLKINEALRRGEIAAQGFRRQLQRHLNISDS